MHFQTLLPLLVVTCHASSIFNPYEKMYDRLRALKDDLDQTVVSGFDILIQEWDHFKVKYGKNYTTEEEDMKRMKIFSQNKLNVARHNDLYEKEIETFAVDINEFSDLTTEEFNDIYLMDKDIMKLSDENFGDDDLFLPLDSMTVPLQKDWRKEGAVTRVRNQGRCGSCWAFSAVGALEGQYFRKTRRLVEMSEQNFLDCSTDNSGCKGGVPRKAFLYAKRNGGIDTEKSYPYEGQKKTCRYRPRYSVKGPIGYRKIEINETKLKAYVGAFGPVSVVIDARSKGFKGYKKGVYFNSACAKNLKGLNHAVLIVGYGTENGFDYWLVKNSWGQKWGDHGYIKMARNRNNNCGIATEAVIPIFNRK